MGKFSDILNKKCDKCNCRLQYIIREFSQIGCRLDFLMCPKCNTEYIARTSILGGIEFEKVAKCK